METLATGFGLVESPRWHDGALWFADWTAGRIHRLLADGSTEVVVEHRSLPLCFDFLPDGSLVLVSGPAQALLRRDPSGELVPYAALDHLSPYGFNDIVVDGRGNAYVNNGNFDFMTGPPAGDVAPGFVALVTSDGRARVVAEDISFPNGMAVTADNRTLVVADSYRHQLVGFDIADDGSLSGRRVWADLGVGTPDGICLDADGACWYADVPNQCCQRVAGGGEVLDTVPLDRGGFACMLGDGGGGGPTLYAVGARWPGAAGLGNPDHVWDGSVFATPAPARAAGWPGHRAG